MASAKVISPQRPYILGCDPGFSGGIAIYDRILCELVEVIDMPIRQKRDKNVIDLDKLSMFVDQYSKRILLSVIEEVGVMTGREGTISMFKFGEGYGMVKGVLGSHYIPIFPVKPAVWKGIENLSSDKKRSISKAIELFPKSKDRFSRIKDNGRAEAAILARFGARFTNVPIFK